MNCTFFTDRDLGRQFPDILRAAGLSVVPFAEHFVPTTPDQEWLAAVGQKGWTAITHDQRIRYKPNELATVVRYNVGLLVVVGKAPLRTLAGNFVATRHRIERFLAGQQRPFIAKVHRPRPAELARNAAAPGSVTLWYPR